MFPTLTMLEILTVDTDPKGVLRKKAARIADVTSPDMRELVTEMIRVMRASEGVGLAAPQIGRSIRLFVIEVDGRVSVFFNPLFVSLSEQKMGSEEGCLSIPDRFFVVDRSERVMMDYADQNGERRRIVAEGFLATVLQHEYDHLEGILFTDRVAGKETQSKSSKTYAL